MAMTELYDELVARDYDVFISYNHQDEADLGVAEDLAEALDAAGYSV